jgi:urease accessory protein
MLVRHCVEESNVDERLAVIDPRLVRHVVIVHGRLESLSGMIDPASHLNLDYADHKVTTCVIAEKFEVKARVRYGNQGLVFASVSRSAFGHYGHVDYTQRFFDMVKAVKKKRKVRKPKKGEMH